MQDPSFGTEGPALEAELDRLMEVAVRWEDGCCLLLCASVKRRCSQLCNGSRLLSDILYSCASVSMCAASTVDDADKHAPLPAPVCAAHSLASPPPLNFPAAAPPRPRSRKWPTPCLPRQAGRDSAALAAGSAQGGEPRDGGGSSYCTKVLRPSAACSGCLPACLPATSCSCALPFRPVAGVHPQKAGGCYEL